MRSIEWTACNVGDVKIAGPTPIPTTPPTACVNFNDYLIIMGGVSFPLPTTAVAPGTAAVPTGSSSTDRFCDYHFGYSNSLVRCKPIPLLIVYSSTVLY